MVFFILLSNGLVMSQSMCAVCSDDTDRTTWFGSWCCPKQDVRKVLTNEGILEEARKEMLSFVPSEFEYSGELCVITQRRVTTINSGYEPTSLYLFEIFGYPLMVESIPNRPILIDRFLVEVIANDKRAVEHIEEIYRIGKIDICIYD